MSCIVLSVGAGARGLVKAGSMVRWCRLIEGLDGLDGEMKCISVLIFLNFLGFREKIE